MIAPLIIIWKSLLLAFLATRFSPINDPLTQWRDSTNRKNPIEAAIHKLLSLATCSKCLSFWSCLALGGSIYLATCTFILMSLYEKKWSLWEHQITLK